jgi:shikimate dehydrogenase
VKHYLVLGDPVAHSLSPVMMAAAFRSAGLDATYAARRVPVADWPGTLDALHREGIAGCNVTVPHKARALADALAATEAARGIGAANTLVRRDGGWEADNTDGPGFLDWVAQLGDGALAAREALVLGAGGSARAVVWALLQSGCPRIRLANRTVARAEELAADAGGAAGAPGRVVAEAPGASAPVGGIVVNCTSLGLRSGDASPLAPSRLAGAARFLDLVYPDPPGVRAAREAGVPAADGVGLLVAQGARSFRRWTGQDADAVAMRAAVDDAIRRR